MVEIRYRPKHAELIQFLDCMDDLESPELEICYAVYLRFACGAYNNYGNLKLPFVRQFASENNLPEITNKVINYWGIMNTVDEAERLHVLRYQFDKARKKREAALEKIRNGDRKHSRRDSKGDSKGKFLFKWF